MEVIAEIMAISSLTNFLSFAFSVTMYVLGSLGLYTIAKRRMIRNPWLAWVPVGSAWILGSISDQYQLSQKSKKTSRRKILMGLEIGTVAAAILMVIVAFVMIFSIAMQVGFEEEYYYNSASYYGPMEESQAVASVLGVLLAILGMTLVIMVISIVYTVFAYMSYYDLYMSCNPGNATVFLVLSIFFSFLPSIFVFVCRNKDEGMRPQMPPPNPWQYPAQGSYPPPPPQPGYPPQPVSYQPPVQPPVQPVQQPPVQPEPPVEPVQPTPEPVQLPVEPVQSAIEPEAPESPAQPEQENNI